MAAVYILTGLAATPTIAGCCRMDEHGKPCGCEISFRPVRGIQLCDTHAVDWLRENQDVRDHQARYGGDAA